MTSFALYWLTQATEKAKILGEGLHKNWIMGRHGLLEKESISSQFRKNREFVYIVH